MTKLKRCPFCGGEAEVENNGKTHFDEDTMGVVDCTEPDEFWVECEKCGAVIGVFSTIESAIDGWNTRTPEEIVRCGECRFFEKESELELVVAYNFCGRYAVNKKPEDFCSWGERRKEK